MDRSCSTPDCQRKHEGLGFCKKHYRQLSHVQNKQTEYQKEYIKKYIRSNRGKYVALKRAAKDKNLGFDIKEVEHIELLKSPCHYCGKIFNECGHGLDRIDNAKGYIKTNVVACCVDCNRAKGNRFTYEEFMLLSPALKAIVKNRNV